MSKYDEAMKLMDEKLGNKDGLISLSTIALEPGADAKPPPAHCVAYYEDGAFYTAPTRPQAVARSPQNPESPFAVIVDSFTADGIGEKLGWVCDRQTRR
jgi:hypothetical protein